MDVPIQNSSFSQEFFLAYSFKRVCFFLLVFVITVIAALGTVALMVIFVLKPQKPIFSVQTLNLDSYKLDVYSNSTLFVSSVVSLSLNAQNPNKVGIRYSRSRLRILNEGLVIGLIRVPEFFQPPHSTNVSVPTRVLFQCVNVSQILSSVSFSSQDDDDDDNDSTHSIAKMRISGDIKAYVRLFHITLPKVKVALDCDINIDDRYLTVSNAMHNIEAVKTQHLFPPTPKHSPTTAQLLFTSRQKVGSIFNFMNGEDKRVCTTTAYMFSYLGLLWKLPAAVTKFGKYVSVQRNYIVFGN